MSLLPVLAVALAAATPNVSAESRTGAGGGICVDVTVDGETTQDAICPPPSDTAVRRLIAGDNTIYYGAVAKPTRSVDLVARRRTVRARVTDRVYAAAGPAALGAIVARDAQGDARASQDLDPFALPGRHKALPAIADEQDRRVRPIVATPRVLVRQPDRRRPAVCLGLRVPDATVVGRGFCVVNRLKLSVRFSAECGERRQLVFGLGPDSVRTARAKLSDGTTAPVTLTRVKDRVVVLARFEGVLVRSVTGYDADGKALATASLGSTCSKTRSKIL